MKFRCFGVLSLSLLSSLAVAAVADEVQCLAYWQLRAVDLEQRGGVQSAKQAARYQASYHQRLAQLKQSQSNEELVAKLYQAVKKDLQQIDNDYSRANELDADYAESCPLAE